MAKRRAAVAAKRQQRFGGVGNVGTVVKCAECGSVDFDLHDFDSMMVLCDQLALFGLRCTRCNSHVFSVCIIPSDMQELVRTAALDVGAGMGREAPADI